MAKNYEYHGLMAESWDLLRGDPSGRFDEQFYGDLIAHYGEPVLDAGCGTGRLLLDFLASGIDMDGVDVSPDMLQLCRRKADARNLSPTLYEQPLEALALPRLYRTILASSSVLQLLTGHEAAQAAVTRLYHHLLPGGALIAPFMTLWNEGMPLQREWDAAGIREQDGAMLQRMGRVWYDRASECEHTEDLYQLSIDGVLLATEHHRRSPASRSYTQPQAYRLFQMGGFVEIRLCRGFSLEAAEPTDQLFTVVGVR